MQAIRVVFENKKYNYITSVASNSTNQQIAKYFAGQWFNLGNRSQEDNMQQCIGVEFVTIK